MANQLVTKLHMNPVIGVMNSSDNLNDLLKSDLEIVFILKTNIFEIKGLVQKIRDVNKDVYVDLDLIDGVSSNSTGLKYVIEEIKPDGIITTKGNLIGEAKHLGINTIQRIFLLDSINLEKALKSIERYNPDAVEILPGVMPKVTKMVVKRVRKPVITGGLILDKEDVMSVLKAGAMGISTSKKSIWDL